MSVQSALRKSATDAERLLWRHLRRRRLGVYFRRQHRIGNYVVDFACTSAKLIVELDGGGHALKAFEDAYRTRWLRWQGYRVIRFWNHEVMVHTDAVLRSIAAHLRT